MEQPPDEDLLRSIAARDVTAFESLYIRYARSAFSLALRIVGDSHTAEDVVQDAFLNVWRMAGSYDGSRGSVRSWLLGTVHHRAVDLYRRMRGRPVMRLPDGDQTATEGRELWEQVAAAMDGEAVQAALAELPAEQREVIELAYFGGYSHREIAEEGNIPLGTVKSRIRIGMDKLRESLKSRRAEP